MSECQVPDSSVVPPAQRAMTRGEFRHRIGAAIVAIAPVFAAAAVVVAFIIMLLGFGMTPEKHVWPVGAPFAVALLVLGLACSVWPLLRRPVTGLRPRRGIQILAGVASLVACLWVPLVFNQVWDYSGPLWRSVENDPSAQWLLVNVLLWVPIGLLVVSVGLASVSCRRRMQLLPWAGVTIPAFVLMLWVVLVAGMMAGGG